MGIDKHNPFGRHLLVRPIPLKGEGLRGYLLRAGEINGYGYDVNLFHVLSGRYGYYYKVSDQAIDNIAECLKLRRDRVELMCCRPFGNNKKNRCIFFSHTIYGNQLRSHQPAVCPECLLEQQAISGMWDLRAVCACPHHGKWLVDQCLACGQPLSWGRTRVAKCNCGFDLRKIEAEAAPTDVLELTALIHEIVLNDLPTHGERSLGYPEELRLIPLYQLLELFRYAADAFVPERTLNRQVCESATAMLIRNREVTLALSKLLKDWPNGLRMALREYSAIDGENADLSETLSVTQFKVRYRLVLGSDSESNSIGRHVPGFFKRALKQFRNDHFVDDTRRGHYLNPLLTCRDPDRCF